VHTLGPGGHFCPDPGCLTEGSTSEPFRELFFLSNTLRDIVTTLYQKFTHSPCNTDPGINNNENVNHVSKSPRLLQEQGPETAERRDLNHEAHGTPRHDNHVLTVHHPSMSTRQPVGASLEATPQHQAPRSQNCMVVSARLVSSYVPCFPMCIPYPTPFVKPQIDRSVSGDIRESASGVYDTTAQTPHPGSVNRNLIGDSHDTSQPQPNPEPAANNAIRWTAINSEGPLTHRWTTKGVPCPIKSCPRNRRSPPKYFARADNLGGHLRKVHGIHIPSRARVRHWVTGNKSQVLLQAAEEKTRELHELGILGVDGTWERPGV